MNRPVKIADFKELEDILKPYRHQTIDPKSEDIILDRIKPFMKYLGNPQDKLKTIHIAGTSGKTSTAYYISSLLNQLDLKVGLAVSPHIDKLSERAQINNETLDDNVFFKEIGIFLNLVDRSNIRPTYFELIYAFSIWLFAKYEVDYAVIETGLGGLYDATNVVSREDKVCVITDIGFDHMSILGNTLKEIAAQKVGIVHKHNPVIMYRQSDEIMTVIEGWIKSHQTKLYLADEASEAKQYGRGSGFSNLVNYQKHNWLLAYYTFRFVAQRDGLKQLNQKQIKNSQTIVIPARMDVIKQKDKLIIFDGAHNHQKMKAFLDSFKSKYPGVEPAVLLAFKEGKDYIKTAPLFKGIVSEVIVTNFNMSRDFPIFSDNPGEVAKSFRQAGVTNVVVEPDNHKAYQQLLAGDEKTLIITGSFYLIAELREKEIKVA